MPNNANLIFNKFLTLFLLIVFLALIYALRSVLLPFAISALLAYLFNPLVHRLMRWGIPRILSVTIVFCIMILFIVVIFLLLIPLIQTQIELLNTTIPKIILWFQQELPSVMSQLGLSKTINQLTITSFVAQNVLKAGGAVSVILKTMLSSGRTIFELLINLALIPVVTFYLLRDWDNVLIQIQSLLPKKIQPVVVQVAKDIDTVLSAFFRGQLLVMLALGVYYAIALTLIGLQTGIIIGFIIGFVSIVPYLGFIIGIVIATLVALVQYGTLSSILWVFLVFIVGNIIENFYLVPNLIGDRVGLHPVVVIFAILAGGTLFGFFGVLLALPIAAIIMVVLRHLHHHYHQVFE